MRERTIDYFDMLNSYINYNRNIQLIISDYGSNDGIYSFIKQYSHFDYIYTEPNEGQYFNISKCNNNAFRLIRNDLVFTNGIDWRYDYNLLQTIVKMFAIHGDIILEPSIVILKEDGGFEKFIHTSVLFRKHIIKAGGWDERIFNWGQEDRDLISSIFFNNPISKITITNKLNTIFHVWHKNILYDKGGGKERNILNGKIAHENLTNNRVNIINSYWYNKEGVLERKM